MDRDRADGLDGSPSRAGQMTNPAELELERVQAMGPTLGPRYHALWTELVWLNMKWQEFETLYAHSADRIELLNRAAPHFFWQLQATMWEDTLLAMARITDPPQSVGKDNLTIQGLEKVIADQALAKEIAELVAAAVNSCRFAKDWRNRRLAHNDLALKLNQSAEPLAAANRKDVRDALDAIGRVLGRIHNKYFNSEVVFSQVLFAGGTEALIARLQQAMQAEEQQREQWKRRLHVE